MSKWVARTAAVETALFATIDLVAQLLVEAAALTLVAYVARASALGSVCVLAATPLLVRSAAAARPSRRAVGYWLLAQAPAALLDVRVWLASLAGCGALAGLRARRRGLGSPEGAWEIVGWLSVFSVLAGVFLIPVAFGLLVVLLAIRRSPIGLALHRSPRGWWRPLLALSVVAFTWSNRGPRDRTSAPAACPACQIRIGRPSRGRGGFIASLGDSSTRGFAIFDADPYPMRLEAMLSSGADGSSLAVCAQNGALIGDLAQQWSAAAAYRPAIVTIMAGIGTSVGDSVAEERAVAEMESLFVAVRRAHARPVLLTYPTCGYSHQLRSARLNALLRDAAARSAVDLVDTARDLSGRPWLFLPDGVHPNSLGHRRIAEALSRYLMEHPAGRPSS